jgi:hypothetical protein
VWLTPSACATGFCALVSKDTRGLPNKKRKRAEKIGRDESDGDSVVRVTNLPFHLRRAMRVDDRKLAFRTSKLLLCRSMLPMQSYRLTLSDVLKHKLNDHMRAVA